MKKSSGIKLKDLAKILEGELSGDGETLISGVSGIREAKEGDITFIVSPKFKHELEQTKASAVIATKEFKELKKNFIFVENPYYAFSKALKYFYEEEYRPLGVDTRAVIGKDTSIGKDVSIHPLAVIGDNAKIGDRVRVYPGVFIGNNTIIGDDTLIYPNVTVREDVIIGKRVILHSGVVIGGDGFGYAADKGRHHKIPQVGGVVIKDDVELGANVTVDRATLGKTIVKRGTKVDNLVQIAHNVVVGEDTIIVAQAGISGSVEIGRHCVIGGQVGFVDHIKIGDNVMIGSQSGVMSDVEPNQVILGSPAMPHKDFFRAQAVYQKLPEMRKKVAELEKRLTELEKKVKE
jgi:UDP-3-O-[3-hydroxymyristoyl] glucosamine N-acyltransferase